MFLGTGIGDTIETFTGIEGAKDRQGILKAVGRLMIALILLAILLGNYHILFLSMIFNLWQSIFG